MSAFGLKLRLCTNNVYMFRCPGCNENHSVTVGPNGWTFNQDAVAPTFSPSVMVKSGHYARSRDTCWCTYNAAHPEHPVKYKCGVCHSFVTNGRIQFLSDCTHALAGQTVDLPNFHKEPHD